MNSLSKFNVLVRRFPSTPPVGAVVRSGGGRPGLIGTPYRPMDPFAVWLMVFSAAAVAVSFFFLEGPAVVPWIFAGAPVSIGVACLLARMVDQTWFARVIALLYTLITAGLLLLAFAQSSA